MNAPQPVVQSGPRPAGAGAALLTPAQQLVVDLWHLVVESFALCPNQWAEPTLWLKIVYEVPNVAALTDAQADDAAQELCVWLHRLQPHLGDGDDRRAPGRPTPDRGGA